MDKKNSRRWCPECRSQQVKKNGRRIIVELYVDRERKIRIERFVRTRCGKSFIVRRGKRPKRRH